MAASLDSVLVVTKLRDSKGNVLDSGFTSLSFGTVAAGYSSEIKIIDMEVFNADLIGNVKLAAIHAETGSSDISETLFISTADAIEDLPEPNIPFPAVSSGSENDPANLVIGQRSDLISRYVAIKAVTPKVPFGSIRVCLKWIFDFGIKQVANESSSSSESSASISEPETSTKKMMSVSLNTYSDQYNNLEGSHNSLALWESLLTSKYSFSVQDSLQDAAATKSAIIHHLENFVENSVSGDILVFGFAGQAILSGNDEAILAYDSPILYSEIASIVDNLPDGVKFIMISEAPFSGTDARSSKGILLSATLSGQASSTASFSDTDNNPVGAFSFYATKILSLEPGMSYRKFQSEIRKTLPQEDFGMIQSPQVECSEDELDTPVFSF